MLEAVYSLVGLMLLWFALLTLGDQEHPRRLPTGAFWLILGILFGAGSLLPHWLAGLLVVALVLLDGLGLVKAGPTPPSLPAGSARLTIPILLMPASILAASLLCRWRGWDLSQGALLGLALGSLLALLAAWGLTGAPLQEIGHAGRRLNDTLGALSLLPQLLASLGVVFARAGVGDWLAGGVLQLVSPDQRVALVVANCLAMAGLAALTGNSFAAFPVVAQGILSPLLLKPFGSDPNALAMLTLAVGASGTLITQMAANFNLVPVALLELKSSLAVIRLQRPVALALFLGQLLFMIYLTTG
ncbi:MAG: DUF979 family protein [Candidatus Eremiobacteraeota bacterium]|nr:DUF979 family protein [Candidatus Eremiobacteraeota bacterium]MCW5872841.1 DUF979 family protein [Candidatus Eremiobacteraeota bacterium]